MQTYSNIPKDNQHTQKYLNMYVYQNKTQNTPTPHSMPLHTPTRLNIIEHTQNDFNIQPHQ